MVWEIVKIGVVLVAATYLMRQVRKPSKWLGRLFTSLMNQSHSDLTDWGLSHTTISEDFTCLDVGCGGGRTLRKLAAIAIDGKVHGIDYAQGSIDASRAVNADLIAAERVEIQKASVSTLPFAANQFDLVTAIETQYYWPDLTGAMREVLRVLKPGGKLVIIAETYKGARNDWILGPLMKLLLGSSHLSASDQRRLFGSAGFVELQISEEQRKGWICVIGTKPLALKTGS